MTKLFTVLTLARLANLLAFWAMFSCGMAIALPLAPQPGSLTPLGRAIEVECDSPAPAWVILPVRRQHGEHLPNPD